MRAAAVFNSLLHFAVAHSFVLNGTGTLPNNSSTPATRNSDKTGAPLGDFIAHGFGISSVSETALVSSNAPKSSPSAVTAVVITTSISSVSVNKTTHISAVITSQAANTSSIALPQCWNSWVDYWEKLPNYGTNTAPEWEICQWTYAPTTVSVTTLSTFAWRDAVPTTVVWTLTRVIDANGFAPSTQYIYDTYTLTESSKGTSGVSTLTWDYTETSSCYATSTSKPWAPPTPNCTLPSTQLSQCQASWETWIDHQLTPSVVRGTRTSYIHDMIAPSCTQATAQSSLCTSLKDAYVSSDLDLAAFSRVLPSINSYVPISHSGGFWRTGQDPWVWPTSAFFAPGCTLGCGRCSIEGGTVQLLYWPPATSTAGVDATATTEAPFLVTTLGTVLTSPTLYVSYHSLYATDGCGKTIGAILSDKIVAIPPESTLSSIWAQPIGPAVIFGYPGDVWTSTASLNITDLPEPVPMSIYSSQPFCASYAQHNAASFNLEGPNAGWDCPHVDSYKPIIKVPVNLLQALEPEWSECLEAFGGAYDPPKALRPVSAIAVPTQESADSTVATEASTRKPIALTPTTGASEPTGSSEHVPAASAHSSRPSPAESTPTLNVIEPTRNGEADETSHSANVKDPSPTKTAAAAVTGKEPAGSQMSKPSGPTEADSSPERPDDKSPQDAQQQNGQRPSDDENNHDVPMASPAPSNVGIDDSRISDIIGAALNPGTPASTDAHPVLGSALHPTVSQDASVHNDADGQKIAEGGAAQDPSPTLRIGSETYTQVQDSFGNVGFANDHTSFAIAAGGSPDATPTLRIGSETYSQVKDSSGNIEFANDHTTIAVSTGAPPDSAPTLLIGSETYSQVQDSSGNIGFANDHTTIAVVTGASPDPAPTLRIGSETYSQVKDSSGNVRFANDHTTIAVPTAASRGPASALLISSDTYSQVKDSSGKIGIANDHTTVFATGGSPMIVGEQKISAGVSNLFVVASGSDKTTISMAQPAHPNLLTIGDQIFTPITAGSGLVYANAETTFTLSPGQSATLIAGVEVSAAASGQVVVGTGSDAITVEVTPAQDTRLLTVGDQTFTPATAGSGLVYTNADTTFTLTPGGPATSIAGVEVSAATSGHIVIGTGNAAITVKSAPTPRARLLTVGSQTLTEVADGTGAVYANKDTTVTLKPGESATSIDGIRVSAASDGRVVVGTGSEATTMTPEMTETASPTLETRVLTLGSQTFTLVASETDIVYANADTTVTLRPGQSATSIDGIKLSVAADGRVVIGTGSEATTVTLGETGTASSTLETRVLTLGSQTFTLVASETDIVYANAGTTVTLRPGQSATSINGIRVSAAADGRVVIGTGSEATTVIASPTRASSKDSTASSGSAKATNTDTTGRSQITSASRTASGDVEESGTSDSEADDSGGSINKGCSMLMLVFGAAALAFVLL